MFKIFSAFFMSVLLLNQGFASLHSIGFETAHRKQIESQFEGMRSWGDVRKSIQENFKDVDQERMLNKLKQLEGEPYRMPKLTFYHEGWTLEQNGKIVEFSLVNKTLTYKGRSLSFDKGINTKEIVDWFELDSKKTSLFSFLISPAYADSGDSLLELFATLFMVQTLASLVIFVTKEICESKFKDLWNETENQLWECRSTLSSEYQGSKIPLLPEELKIRLTGPTSSQNTTCADAISSKFMYFSLSGFVKCMQPDDFKKLCEMDKKRKRCQSELGDKRKINQTERGNIPDKNKEIPSIIPEGMRPTGHGVKAK